MPGKATQAPNGSIFFDCDTPLDHKTAETFKSAGFQGAGRYLSRVSGVVPGDLTAQEAAVILAAGLAIVPVQHVPAAGWTPSVSKGNSYGFSAVINVKQIGCPTGVNVWLDLEGVSVHATAKTIADYCNAWYTQVFNHGYLPGLYVGANCGLTNIQLYTLLEFHSYWHAGSSSAPIPIIRGVQIKQTIAGKSLAGISYDSNIVNKDNLGSLPFWWTN